MSVLGKTLSGLRKILLVLALVGLLGGAGWGIWHWRGSSDNSFHFRTEKVTRGRVAALINASGTVVPEEVVDIGAQVAGQIISFGKDLDNSNKTIDYGARVEGPVTREVETVKDGKTVKEVKIVTPGTLLALIDPKLYQSDLDIARADLAVAKADVDRTTAELEVSKARLSQAAKDIDRARRLSTTSSIAAQEYDGFLQAYQTAKATVPASTAAKVKAERNVLRAEEMLKKAETNLGYTEIRSPVKGVIVDRRVNIGQTVVSSLNAPSLFLIAKDLKKMQVWVSVNEADVGQIRVGQAANFKVDAYPDEVFSGVVAQIRLNASMTQNVVTYTVVVNTPNDNLRLLPYLTANLQFRVDERPSVLRVPNGALRYRPAVERVDPEYRSAYLATRRRKASTPELKSGGGKKETRGTVWVEENGFLKPVRLQIGLSDGNVTEVIRVLEGDLGEDAEVVTGELQSQSQSGSNPFAIKMFSGKKKD
jgi:HlyD family secretion protein